MKSTNHVPSPSSPPFTFPLPTNTPHTVPVLQTSLSMLIPKSVFKGVCIPTMSRLYFGEFSHFHFSPSSLPSHSALFNSFQYICLYYVENTQHKKGLVELLKWWSACLARKRL
jgi:hypothetical protein